MYHFGITQSGITYPPFFSPEIRCDYLPFYWDGNKHPSIHVGFVRLQRDTVDGMNPSAVEVGSLPKYLQCFIHPRWLAGPEPSTVSLFFVYSVYMYINIYFQDLFSDVILCLCMTRLFYVSSFIIKIISFFVMEGFGY